jgi:hypothetical protein
LPQDESKKGIGDVAQIAAAVSAVVAVVASLAVTGILAKAQRDHGVELVIGFGFVLFGAVLWLIATVMPTDPQQGTAACRWNHWKTDEQHQVRRYVLFPYTAWLFLRARWQPLSRQAKMQILSGALFGIGLFIAIWGLVVTQQDSERPAISASFNRQTAVLSGTVTAVDLDAAQRVEVRVDGLNEHKSVDENGRDVYVLVADPRVLYQAVLGPDTDGKVNHTLKVQVPKRDHLIGIKAWTGKGDVGCYFSEDTQSPEAEDVAQNYRDACIILRTIHGTPSK